MIDTFTAYMYLGFDIFDSNLQNSFRGTTNDREVQDFKEIIDMKVDTVQLHIVNLCN